MSITLDVNAFLNKDVGTQSNCNGAVGGGNCDEMEKEMETTNIFDEIEHLLKFNKNLEFPNEVPKVDDKQNKQAKKTENYATCEPFNLDFLSHSDDFLLTSESQSLLGEDSLLFSVEKDRLQPLNSKFMVPGIYKRIEGVVHNDCIKKPTQKSNVFITDLEKTGRILTETEFERLYILDEHATHNPVRKVALEEPVKSDEENTDKGHENDQEVKSPKELDGLSRLAYDILQLTKRDHIVIDHKRNEIIRTQYRTNQKTIYRVRQPEMLALKENNGETNDLEKNDIMPKPKIKLGRPKKRPNDEEDISKKPAKICKKQTPIVNFNETKHGIILKTASNLRTRYGRLVRVPPTSQELDRLIPDLPAEESVKNILNDLKDSSYHNSKVVTHTNTAPPNEQPTLNTDETMTANEATTKRKVPPEAICPTCRKIFLGRRMQRHLAQHPDHIKVPIPKSEETQTCQIREQQQQSQPIPMINSSNYHVSEDMSLFQFLVSKLQRSQQLNEDQKAELFLNELNDLIEQIQLRSSRLIRNTSGLHLVNQRCSKLLGIPEGQYALDLAAIELPAEPEMQDNCHSHNLISSSSNLPNHINSRSLDYTNLSITLDDTLTDEAAQKLNLSAGGKLLPPSEESLLRAVDDLVQTDISKIKSSNVCVSNSTLRSSNTNNNSVVGNLLPPHIDHVSDNAVEAVHMKETPPSVGGNSKNPLLDLAVDFFQFNN